MARMNQRDQAHAYRFLARRLSAALVRDDPDSPDAPMRKLAIASFGSIMVAALAVAAAGIFGLLRPGGATAWKSGQAVILEKETGTRYIYTGGELHPVLNYASARLVLGKTTFSMVSASEASLRGVRRGLAIGIPGAPDELPTPSALVTGPWSVCSLPAQDSSGTASAYVRVSIGQRPTGSPLPGSRGLLVESPDGALYLIWNGSRLRILGGQAALTALGYASIQPLVVGDAWLSVMPQPADLVAPEISGIGARGPTVGNLRSRVGQVFSAMNPSGAIAYYLTERGGLAPLTATEAYLMVADPATKALYPSGNLAPIRVSAASIAAAAALPPPVGQALLPARPPTLLSIPGGQGGVCAVYASANAAPVVSTFSVPAPAVPTLTEVPPLGRLGIPLADQVRIPAGDGAVVQAASAPGLSGGTVYLITSQGIMYPLSSASLLPSLGLANVSPVPVLQSVLYLLPTGPTLDPAAARLTTRQ
jgi:type VII secretion protein EccB